jgi:hypothetical protein
MQALNGHGFVEDYEASDGLVWAVSKDGEGQLWCAEWKAGKAEVRKTECFPEKKHHKGGSNRNCSVQCCGPYADIIWQSATSRKDVPSK